MRFGVLRFPGSCDENDALLAAGMVGDAEIVSYRERDLNGVDAVIVPGGFTYGDYLRAGAIARLAPVMEAVISFAADGGLVLGICNGFQVLCEARLLPGALLPNAGRRFICRQVQLDVVNVDTPFTAACAQAAGQPSASSCDGAEKASDAPRAAAPAQGAAPEDLLRLSIPAKHSWGRWYAPTETLQRMEQRGQVVLRYAPGQNFNGSTAEVAGVCNEAGNVFGLMPHPEHAVDELSGSTDGLCIFESMRRAAQGVRTHA